MRAWGCCLPRAHPLQQRALGVLEHLAVCEDPRVAPALLPALDDVVEAMWNFEGVPDVQVGGMASR